MPWRLPTHLASDMAPGWVALLFTLLLSSLPLRAQATSTSVQRFQHAPASTFDSFGRSIALQGGRALITSQAVDGKGAAFSYRRIGGVWTPSEKLRGSDTQSR